jgi:hypothetical protein
MEDVMWKSEVDKRLNEIEKVQAVHGRDIDAIKEDMKAIKSNTTWILRIVIGALILLLLDVLTKGGQL